MDAPDLEAANQGFVPRTTDRLLNPTKSDPSGLPGVLSSKEKEGKVFALQNDLEAPALFNKD